MRRDKCTEARRQRSCCGLEVPGTDSFSSMLTRGHGHLLKRKVLLASL